ncbi:L-lactate permease [Micromonospora sp. NBC_00898]|uniref:L-lactate permease n=1 Tax=Micromonospora sp. NBC_00898 TaxID=2975981 RepID=UPI003862F4AD|nr:L-lactate permease [Micromonospora sp. NBC_00898]
MYEPDLAPLAGSLPLSALVALVPLAAIFFMLGVLRTKAHWAALAAVAVATGVAVGVYHMPAKLALLSASEGAVFGLFPIMWIVFTAIWVYQLTVVSGRFEDLRRAFQLISDDPRIQAIIIAFCFGGLLEALAGFGAPVAITGVMLLALGFGPLRAATTVLVANTAPVAFGAIAIPIITAGTLTKIPYEEIGAYVGRQSPVLALIVPLLLVFLVDGRRGVRQTWPAALVCGGSFGAAQFASANFISVELTDIVASLAALVVTVAFLQIWRPRGGAEALATLRGERGEDPTDGTSPAGGGSRGSVATVGQRTAARVEITTGRVVMALMPYLVIIAVFSVAKLWEPAKTFLLGQDVKIEWPGLHGQVLTVAGKVSSTTIYTFPWLSSPGTMLLLAGILVTIIYRISPVVAARELVAMAVKLRWAFLTVASVLALAYVMNLSGQTITVGAWIAGTGAAFAFLSPILGWLGTAVTGSDTSANALFATMQQTAAAKAGLDPTLMVAANTSGGVVGKMISPQNLTIAVTAVGQLGKEHVLFRKVIRWSLLMLLGLCLLVFLQSNVLAWMLP